MLPTSTAPGMLRKENAQERNGRSAMPTMPSLLPNSKGNAQADSPPKRSHMYSPSSEHLSPCVLLGKLTQVLMNQCDWARSGPHLTSATLHLSCSTSEQHQAYFFQKEWNAFNHPEQISLTRLQNVQTFQSISHNPYLNPRTHLL